MVSGGRLSAGSCTSSWNAAISSRAFARVRCPQCREEFLVAYSCRVRCFCPSCHEKRALEKAGWVAEHVCAEVPHRQFVFTMPKRLRIYFRFARRLLGELCRAAARTVITVYGSASGRPDAVPGVIGAIQTFGQLVHWHPHIHALVSEIGSVLLSQVRGRNENHRLHRAATD